MRDRRVELLETSARSCCCVNRETLLNNHVIMQIEVYEPQRGATLPILQELGMRPIHQYDNDFYFTNLPAADLR